MRDKQLAGIFLEIFMLTAMLAALAALALPHVSQMTGKARFESRVREFQNIHTAVNEMLADSLTGVLEPAGPTADMGAVRTSDVPALVLKDYLPGVNDRSLKLGCAYSFYSDGTINQIAP